MKLINLSAIIVIIAVLLSTSCRKDLFCGNSSGDIVTNTLTVSSFTGVDLSIASNVIISQGDEFEVKAKGNYNVVNAIDTRLSGEIWKIEFKDRNCYNNYDLTIYITVPDINVVAVGGSGDIIINDFINQTDLVLDVSGSGTINLNAFEGAQYISANISGSGTIRGNKEIDSINKLDIIISGSGEFKGYPIITNNCDIKIYGSGNCYVNVKDNLDVKINGSGNVYYIGTPNINSNISGSGSLVNRN